MISKITVAHPHLENPLVVSDDYFQLLIVENPKEFYELTLDLISQSEGETGRFVFSENDEIFSLQKRAAVIFDPFRFDLNEKKLLNLLYKKAETVALNETPVLFNELNAKLLSFLGELDFRLPVAVEYAEAQPADYFKISGLKFKKDYASLEEKIICYMNAFIELKRCDFFVFVNLKSVLTDQALLKIYEHCRMQQVGALLFESGKHRPLLECEKAVIITDDLCEILENYGDM